MSVGCAQAARDDAPLDGSEQRLQGERHQGGRDRALEDQAEVVQADAGQDWLSLFRGIEAYEPTLLVDEADTFL